MTMFGLSLCFYMTILVCLRFDVRGELTADVVYSLLSSRLEHLELETFSIKTSIDDRIDQIEMLIKSQLPANTHVIEVSEGRNEKDDIVQVNQAKDTILNAFASEKLFIRNALTEYEEQFTELRKTVNDQMNLMTKSIEASNQSLERKIKETKASMNNSLNQFKSNSDKDLQEVIIEFETAMNNTATEHETTVSKVNDVCNSVKNIENDLSSQSSQISAVDDRLSSLYNSGWSSWNEWSNCSLESGCEGFKTRTRTCFNPLSLYGIDCNETSKQRTSCLSLECVNGPSDCAAIKNTNRASNSGVYTIYLWKTKTKVEVYCDMDTDGGGWTVFQRRFNGSVDFYRTFHEYENGFGQIDGEFWLGLKTIQEMTSNEKTELRLDLTAADGSQAYELFNNFYISPGRKYTLHIDKGTGTAGDGQGLSYNNEGDFVTKDYDNSNGCAMKDQGGWWYKNCAYANLNGEYVVPGTKSSYQNGEGGVTYRDFKGHQSLKSTVMMFRKMH